MCASSVREDVTGAQLRQPESLELLVRTIAHDINNLLTVITGFGTFAADDISAAQRNGCVHLEGAPAYIEKILTAANNYAGNPTLDGTRIIGAPTHVWHRMFGSVSGWLARHASCPVIVVP